MKTPPIGLNQVIDDIPAKEWIWIDLPFSLYDYSESMVHPTCPYDFDHARINSIHISARIDFEQERTLYIDEIKIYSGGCKDNQSPLSPFSLNAIGYARHINLQWIPNSEDDLRYYKIYRSFDAVEYKPKWILYKSDV